jgi:hypothetical protein
MLIPFPKKIIMSENIVDDVKCIIPPLDLTRMNKDKCYNYNYFNENKDNSNKKNSLERIKILEKNEIWNKLIKNLDISKEEIERYFENKMLNKLILLIENLVNLINEKNKKIKNSKNEINKLRNENITISNNLIKQGRFKFKFTDEDISEYSIVFLILYYIILYLLIF